MMALTPVSDSGEFLRLCRKIRLAAPALPLTAVLGYLALVVDLGVAEWMSLSALFVVYALIAGSLSTSNLKAGMALIAQALESPDERPAGETESTKLDSLSARLTSLPAEMWRMRVGTMLLLTLIIPSAMTVFGFEGWFSWTLFQTFSLAIVGAALGSASLEFYLARAAFRPFRLAFSRDDSAAQPSGTMPARISLVRILQCSVVMPLLVGLMLMLNLISEQSRAAAEADAIEWSRVAISAVLESGLTEGLAERIAKQNEIQKSWPRPVAISLHSLDRLQSGGSTQDATALFAAIDELLESSGEEGVLNSASTPSVGVYRRIDASSVVAATVDRSRLVSSFAEGGLAPGLLLIALAGLAFGLSLLVSRDFGTSIAGLRRAVAELEGGEASVMHAFETGDELGELGQSFYRFGSDLRRTTENVSSALDEVEQSAAGAMAVVEALAAASAEHSDRLQQAMDLVISIDARGCEISNSAEGLNASVDESSSSIAELGAAGAELNETASVLSAKVDEVSSSMEHIVSSVKQVSATTEKLASASEDTSSSMEEMASAMRVVDTSAETMAGLSLDVVAKAEVGQAKVCQTIEGMEAIREATDVAERVIRGLGSRTLEIGGILDVIDDVADETNLLALNAAIIAAQAGEHGKAFSVVADEIKELADRVLASTKEIGGLIRSVQEESENAIGAIEAGSQSVMSGVDLSAEAGRTLEEITEASRQNGVRIGEIVSSVREQTKAAGHVVELMERVRDSADEISTASGEQDRGNEIVYRSSLTMREVAQQVRRTTEEQSHGFGRIRESVEGVRSTVEHITGSLREQAGSCGEVSAFLSELRDGIHSNEEAYEKMGGAMKELLSQAAALRDDVERSKIS